MFKSIIFYNRLWYLPFLLLLFAAACAPAASNRDESIDNDSPTGVIISESVEKLEKPQEIKEIENVDDVEEAEVESESKENNAINDSVDTNENTAAAEIVEENTKEDETEDIEEAAEEKDDGSEEMIENTMEDTKDKLNRRSKAEIFTNDDRSVRLESLTSDWNTDWEMRTIATAEILSGGPPRDGIPPIDEPAFVTPEEAAEWLSGNEPVIAININGDARAYPLQIMTWHEIVNDEVGGLPVLVTFCPLCNSAIVFDRHVDGQVFDFGTSGLLRNSDLIMYDRQTESLWQQFIGEGIVGEMAAVRLDFVPSLLISFDDFVAQHPDGQILSKETGFNRQYGRNPYAGYDTIGSNPFLFDGVVDGRLAATERVITIAAEDIGADVAYPLSVLTEAGVINDMHNGNEVVVFHDPGTSSALGAGQIAEGADVGAAGVYNPVVNGETLIFERSGELIIDTKTGSTWNIHGVAIDGELAGTQLEPIVHANHFWFAWAAFKPDTVIFEG